MIECGRDLKQLYKLVEHLTGTKADNALPCRSSKEDLANEFADFFISKIRKIRDNLSQYEGYVPTRTKDIPPLSQLELLSWKLEDSYCAPSPKKAGAELVLSNYRPVSNLSFISKMVEKAALLRFDAHCNQHELMPDYHQHIVPTIVVKQL